MQSMYQADDTKILNKNDYRTSANQTKVLTMNSETEINLEDHNFNHLNLIKSDMSLKY
jgi:hypothetical protein